MLATRDEGDVSARFRKRRTTPFSNEISALNRSRLEPPPSTCKPPVDSQIFEARLRISAAAGL